MGLIGSGTRIALFMLLSPKSTTFEVMAFCCGIGKNVLKHQPAAVCYKHSSGFGAEGTAFWCCENITGLVHLDTGENRFSPSWQSGMVWEVGEELE